ncbi:hypothetical protein [Lyticum sinuosum]|uniref:Uncharacterized protein n=1 Tax=Lyticum sinuosum TaxID=1332059 RepID=A0AAE4VKI6_9RICK|nr:hypothetical protein [Lyticum sinuosum]MDZ5760904.1 hypothetical protein [Lyticum sinuosum]
MIQDYNLNKQNTINRFNLKKIDQKNNIITFDNKINLNELNMNNFSDTLSSGYSIKGLNIESINSNNNLYTQNIIGSQREKIYSSMETRSTKVFLKGILHHLDDAKLMRDRFFNQKDSIYCININDFFMICGLFFITTYNISINNNTLPILNIELRSSSYMMYIDLI